MPLDRSVGNYFDSSGSFIRRVARWTGPTSYTTGGEVIDASTFGLGKIVALLITTARSPAALAFPVYDYTAGRLLWYDIAGAQIANGVNLSAYTAGIEVIGN
jgi:hypothetical protein